MPAARSRWGRARRIAPAGLTDAIPGGPLARHPEIPPAPPQPPAAGPDRATGRPTAPRRPPAEEAPGPHRPAGPGELGQLLRRYRRTWLGPPGPAAGRTVYPLRLPVHQETTAQLRGTYPFLAEAGLPAMGMYIGQERFTRASFCFDPFRLYGTRPRILTNPSTFLAGVIGCGKSSLSKTLLYRAQAFGYRFAVPGDVRGEYQPLARAVGIDPVVLGPGMTRPLNALSAPTNPPGMDHGTWWDTVRAHWEALLEGLIRAALPGQRELTPTESTALELALDHITGTGDGSPQRAAPACLPRLMDALFQPDPGTAAEMRLSTEQLRQATADLALVVRKLVKGSLRGLVAGTDRTTFDATAPGVVIDLSRLRLANDAGIALAMACIQSMMELAFAFAPGRRLVVYDELWRLIGYPALVTRIMAGIKLTRHTGTAHLLITHRISDLLGGSAESQKLALGLLADCATRIIYRQATDQIPATAQALELTGIEAEQLPLLGQGSSLWKIERRSYLVDHIVLRDGLEWPIIDTDQAMTDQYRFLADPPTQMARWTASEQGTP
jgi:hypothetical protein